MSLYQITNYSPNQRDTFGQYEILPGHVHVFSFSIPLLGSIDIEAAHILPNSQDFSIDLWISSDPLDGLLLGQDIGHFALIRRQTQFQIYDEFLKTGDEDQRLFLSSGRTFFINIKNLQNRKNAYELHIEENSPTP